MMVMMFFLGGFFLGALAMGLLIVGSVWYASAKTDRRNWSGE